LRERIFLVGFMCSGKTTVGRIVAQKLRWDFVDTDEEIEKREGFSIPEIFEKKGEDYFRRLELEVLKELSKRRKVVVSTGGGLGANPEAMELMKDKGLVVWLPISYEEFIKRCGKDGSRPLLKKGEEELRRLLSERNKIYSHAHLKLPPGEPEELARRILSLSQP